MKFQSLIIPTIFIVLVVLFYVQAEEVGEVEVEAIAQGGGGKRIQRRFSCYAACAGHCRAYYGYSSYTDCCECYSRYG
ncbi:unnamed protein product [Meloidogyne enterolobii]|uniref:Uncharacterized protein n=3 Tax=Meloidogyne enterolobii TaxID=390850 RepID=A0A6V7WUQ6_MELEN|nr:unnamed protein product [Meloidogyne enterolobii]